MAAQQLLLQLRQAESGITHLEGFLFRLRSYLP